MKWNTFFQSSCKNSKKNSDSINVSGSLNTNDIHAFNINSFVLLHSRYAHIGKNSVITTSKNNLAIDLPK